MLFGREFALIIRNRRAYFFSFYFRYIWRMVSEIKTMLYRFLCIFTICAFTSEKSIKTHNSDFCSVLFCEYNLIKLDPFSFFIPFTSDLKVQWSAYMICVNGDKFVYTLKWNQLLQCNVFFYDAHTFFTNFFFWHEEWEKFSFGLFLIPVRQKKNIERKRQEEEKNNITDVNVDCYYFYYFLQYRSIDAKLHVFIFIAWSKLLNKTFDVRKILSISVSLLKLL